MDGIPPSARSRRNSLKRRQNPGFSNPLDRRSPYLAWVGKAAVSGPRAPSAPGDQKGMESHLPPDLAATAKNGGRRQDFHIP